MAKGDHSTREEALKVRDLIRHSQNTGEGAKKLQQYVPANFRVKTNKNTKVITKRVGNKRIFTDVMNITAGEAINLNYPHFEKLIIREMRENGSGFTSQRKSMQGDLYEGDEALKVSVLEVHGIQPEYSDLDYADQEIPNPDSRTSPALPTV